MDELVPLYDSAGVSSGVCALKSEAHKYGWWHGTVHVWILNDSGQVYFQKRSRNKKVFPGLWDVSVAGHINGWEEPRNAALREVLEELGLEMSGEHLRYIGTFPAEVFHGDSHILDREHHHAFIYTVGTKAIDLSPNPVEVSEISTFPSPVEKNLFDTGSVPGFVPHATDYLKVVAEGIRSVFP
jgi:isopentenyldiphosphate isomerase